MRIYFLICRARIIISSTWQCIRVHEREALARHALLGGSIKQGQLGRALLSRLVIDNYNSLKLPFLAVSTNYLFTCKLAQANMTCKIQK